MFELNNLSSSCSLKFQGGTEIILKLQQMGVFVLSNWADEHKSPCHALKQLYSHCILDVNEFDFCSYVILDHCVACYI